MYGVGLRGALKIPVFVHSRHIGDTCDCVKYLGHGHQPLALDRQKPILNHRDLKEPANARHLDTSWIKPRMEFRVIT